MAPKFNKQRGRHCFKFSKPEVRADLIKIEWDGKKSDAKDRASLLEAMHILAEWQRKEGGPADIEAIMKGLGMCIWSWPFTNQESDAYGLMAMSTAGQGITFPHPTTGVDDQPNLFFDFLHTYFKAKADYQEKYRGSDT